MSLIVQKYGGSSIATSAQVLKVAQNCAHVKSLGNDLIIVVSAMGDTTDKLNQLADEVTQQPYSREMDMLLSAGERISMALLSMALQEKGIPAISFTGSQVGLITEDKHQNARILRITGERIQRALHENKVVIVAGFQGVSTEKEITTLGRGGSDTTAVALAARFKALKCEIYTDVLGVYTADPSIEPKAYLNEKVCYSPMIEYALGGAGVLHPRSVALAKKYEVPLYVYKSLMNENNYLHQKGSIIVSDDLLEKENIIGVTLDKDKGFVVLKMPRPTVSLSVIEYAQKANLEFFEPHIFGNQFSFFIHLSRESDWKDICDELCLNHFLEGYEFLLDKKPVSLVADSIGTDGKILSQALNILSDQNIFIENLWVSGLKVTFCIDINNAEDALKLLHEKFLEKER